MKKDSKLISKKKAIFERITHLEDAISKAKEYLETGNHADWHGFRALYVNKEKNGENLPPHKDWVKNVFLPNKEKALNKEENKLEKLN